MEELKNRLRLAWEGLNDRERKLVGLMGFLFGAMVLLMPLVLMMLSNQELDSDIAEVREVLAEIQSRRVELDKLTAERRAAEQRYEQQAPSLGSFVEGQAREQGLTLREVTDQPEQTMGNFVRRNVRVALPGVELTPVMNLLAAIKNSPYPVAIEHLQIEHYQKGDKYNVKLGVVTYDKKQSMRAQRESTVATGAARSSRP